MKAKRQTYWEKNPEKKPEAKPDPKRYTKEEQVAHKARHKEARATLLPPIGADELDSDDEKEMAGPQHPVVGQQGAHAQVQVASPAVQEAASPAERQDLQAVVNSAKLTSILSGQTHWLKYLSSSRYKADWTPMAKRQRSRIDEDLSYFRAALGWGTRGFFKNSQEIQKDNRSLPTFYRGTI